MQHITPNLWFDTQAEQAVAFYTALFPNSKILNTARYTEEMAKVSGQPAGSVVTIEFEILGQRFIAINGGPIFKFTHAVSFMVECDTQEEIDTYWNALTEGGAEEPCGWALDKYGLSWQIVPRMLNEMMMSKDAAKAQRTTHAMLQMKKLDIKGLTDAYNQA